MLQNVRCSDNVFSNSASPPGQVAGIDRAFVCDVSPPFFELDRGQLDVARESSIDQLVRVDD